MADTKLRKLPKQQRAEDTVKTILEAACEVLEQLGPERFERFQTANVAKKAGVSIGTLYQYFPNKSSLLAEVLDYCNRTDLELVNQKIQSSTEREPIKLLKQCIALILKERWLGHTGLYKVIAHHRETMCRPDTNREIQEKIVSSMQVLLEQKLKLKFQDLRYVTFLLSRGCIDLFRSTLLYRPEYILDPRYHEVIADFLTAHLANKIGKSRS